MYRVRNILSAERQLKSAGLINPRTPSRKRKHATPNDAACPQVKSIQGANNAAR